MLDSVLFKAAVLSLSALAIAVSHRASAADSTAPVALQTYRTHSRLILRVDEGVESEWKDIPGGFELLLKGITLSDLGAPLGEEDAWVRQKTDVGDSRLASLTLKETADAVVVVGKWKLPVGDQAPAEPKMDRFDYRQKSPARFVVDFWLKDGPTLAQLRAEQKRAARLAQIKRASDAAQRQQARKLASVQQKSEREDLGRFCKQPQTDENDVSLPFLPAREPLKLSRWFPSTTADTDYFYREPKATDPALTADGKTSATQYVRLALDLYRQGKPALAVRTIDFLDAEHPESDYRHEMRFLRANSLIRLGKVDEALAIFKALTTDAKDRTVALYSAMFVAGKYFEKQNHLQALETFLWLTSNYSDHRLAWVFRLGTAESLASMKQTERAAQEYQWVSQHAPDDDSRTLGAFRAGDLYLERQQYEQALAQYYRASQRFPNLADLAPYTQVNRAEALYWLKDYPRASEAFQAFLTRFPAHPIGWRATLRLGEIASRELTSAARGRKWFYDTINRHPYSPGATLARLKLLPCGDHGGMTADAAIRFFEGEAKTFREKHASEVVMKHYQDFAGLTEVRSLIAFGQEERAAVAAIREIRTNAESITRALISDLLQTVFRKKIVSDLAAGREYEALKFYQENVSGLPRSRPGYSEADPDYLLQLSRAAARHGLPGLAEKLTKSYAIAQASFASSTAVPVVAAGGRKPASDQAPIIVDDRIKTSERAFTEAKALWSGSSGADESEREQRIRKLLAQVAEESEFSYGRELILGLLDQRTGKLASALSHAVRAQLLAPKENSYAEAARLSYWVAWLQARAGESRAAVQAYRDLAKFAMSESERAPAAQNASASAPAVVGDKASDGARGGGLAAELGVPSVPAAATLILAEGEILAGQGRWGEAAQAYARAVEEKLGGNQALFEYARALGKSGDAADRAKSVTALKRLAESDTDDFWRRLAREALANQQTSAKEGRP